MLYNHIPDENVQQQYAPKYKESDFTIEFEDLKSTCFIYLKDNITEFIEYLYNNFNIILYHTGNFHYASKILKIIDVNKRLTNVYGQEQCHLYYNLEEEKTEYIRDINLFCDIPLNKKIILDSPSYSNVLSPDNILFFNKYIPDSYENDFKVLIDELEEVKKYNDVREYLIGKYDTRKSLILSKLI